MEAEIINKNQIKIPANLEKEQNLKVVLKNEADIPLAILKKEVKNNETYITVSEVLNKKEQYLIAAKDMGLQYDVNPSLFGIMLATILSAALVNNFVFTKYLGLCVFFGTSKKKDTAIGMGVTFTVVCVLSGLLAWVVHHFALQPLKLKFLEIIVFIGIVAALVQASDTILKKINPILHRKFGIYIVLITTNCIILAVPLLNASAHASLLDSMSLSIGAGLGFALALFLMSCAREKAEIAPIPEIFKGLPIAFIIAGLFALSFLGFSGLKLL